MNTKYRIGVVLAAAGVFFIATCAPTDPPERDEKTSPANIEGSSAAAPDKPVAAPPQGLQQRIELAIDQVRRRDLLTTNGFWTIFHGILGLGPSVTLLDPNTGTRTNALDHICAGGQVRGMRFIPTEDGLDVQTGPMFVGQGHQDQYSAEMAQWGMSADRKFLVNGKEYTFMDFVRHTQMRARVSEKQELAWAILTISQYHGTKLSWINRAGEQLHFEDLIRYEVNTPVEEAACGGTHSLFGLTWAYYLHLREGGKKTGVWQELADKLLKYQKLARKTQNADGSFSTNFFREPGNAPDMQLRINTTGHILEWLALSLPESELKAGWVQDAVNALSLMIFDIQDREMEGGTLYHAVHGLLIYYARVYDARKLGANQPHVPLPPGQK